MIPGSPYGITISWPGWIAFSSNRFLFTLSISGLEGGEAYAVEERAMSSVNRHLHERRMVHD